MKTSELIDGPLDWAVASVAYDNGVIFEDGVVYLKTLDGNRGQRSSASTNWSQGGPIIEREGVSISRHPDGANWMAWIRNIGTTREGSTPLIAAMRCYCCAKLGDEINIPEELCPQQPT